MKLTDFVTTTTLTPIQVSTPAILEKYGEPLDFFIMSPIPLEEYVTIGALSPSDFVKKMVLDENGNQVMTEGQTLNTIILKATEEAIWAELGKLPERP